MLPRATESSHLSPERSHRRSGLITAVQPPDFRLGMYVHRYANATGCRVPKALDLTLKGHGIITG
jgi:hypothetical protein